MSTEARNIRNTYDSLFFRINSSNLSLHFSGMITDISLLKFKELSVHVKKLLFP